MAAPRSGDAQRGITSHTSHSGRGSGRRVTGVYGGYFGAGSGVMMLAVLGLGTTLEFWILNAQKTFAVMVANVVASVVFVAIAPVDWRAVGVLAAGSVVGGYAGSHLGRWAPRARHAFPRGAGPHHRRAAPLGPERSCRPATGVLARGVGTVER
ncbi:sulfite exporter TauE/SafE family protein [Knoellia locipacati]|uniref:sulfite exporter TauE/SafE family protein n=1 Tax=Knoellia locipacati TaxID=882824 RepID=UPI00384E58D1